MTDATLSARLDTADAERRARELADELRKLGRAGHEMEDGLDDAGKASKKAGTEFDALQRTVSTVLTLEVARRVAVATAEFVALGSAVAETRDKFEVTLGPSIGVANQFLDEFATKAGLARSEGQELLANATAIAQAMGFVGNAAAELGTDILSLAGDIGAYNNIPTAEVAQAIQSALNGEREALKRFNVVLTEAEVQQRALVQSGKDVAAELTKQERATATLQLITEQAGVAIGNLDQTQGSLAAQTRAVEAEFRTFRETLALAAAEGAQASGAMAELRDVLERLNTNGDTTRAVFEQFLSPLAEFAQKVEEAQISAAGLSEVFDILENAGSLGFRGTIGAIKEVNDGIREQIELSREEFAQRRDISDEQRATEAELLERRQEFNRLLRERNQRIRDNADEERRAAEEAEEAEKKRIKLLKEREAAEVRASNSAQRAAATLLNLRREVEKDQARESALEAEKEAMEALIATGERLNPIIAKLNGSWLILDNQARDAAETAEEFKQNWLGALQQVGNGFGDLGGAIAGIIGEIANGNPFGVLGAGIGGIIGFLNSDAFGGGGESYQGFTDLFEETKRLREAFRELGDELSESLDIRRLRALGDDVAAQLEQERQNAADELSDFIEEFLESGILQSALPRGQRPDDDFFADASIAELEELLGSLEQAAFGAQGDLAEFLRTLIELKEVQALEEVARQERERAAAAEEAARALAEAEARERALQALRDERAIREAALESPEAAATVRAEIERARELAALAQLLEDGEIPLEEYEAWVELISREAADAVEEAIRREQELAEARREATRAAEEDLEIRELLLKGMTNEAKIRRLEIEQRDELMDAIERGEDEAFLDRLRDIQAGELEDFIRSLQEAVLPEDNRTDRGFNDPGATDFGAPDTGNSSASITAIANTDAVIAIQLSQLAVLRSIDRKMDGGGGLTQVSPSTTLPATDGVDASLATRFERSLRSQGRV